MESIFKKIYDIRVYERVYERESVSVVLTKLYL